MAQAPPVRLREALQGIERAVIWMRDSDGSLTRACEAAGVRDVRCAPGLPGAEWPGHAADYYLHTVGTQPLGAFQLKFPPQPGLDIVIAPGSGSPRKNWPLENFQGVADYFIAQGRNVTCLLGPAEEGNTPLRGTIPLFTPDLVTLSQQLTAANLFIGNDTGPTHLAALCGCPTLAIFGPASTATWHPIGAQIIATEGTWPSIENVLRRPITLGI